MERRKDRILLVVRRPAALAVVVAAMVAVLAGAAMAASVPYTSTSPVTSDPLTTSILEQFTQAELGKDTRLAVQVAEPQTGIVYVQVNAEEPLKPASLIKLVTTAVALDVLGPDRTFTTTVETPGTVDKKGVLHGDLIVRGGGDPSLGPRFQADPSKVTAVLDDWADQLRKKGIREVSGDIVADGSRYEDDPIAIGWESIDLAQWYSAEVSALNFNDNTVDLIWKAGKTPGDPAEFEIVPQTSYLKVVSTVRSGPASMEKPRLRYFRYRDGSDIRARGMMPPGTKKYDFAAIHDPARYTAHLFMEALERRGIVVKGTAMNARAIGGAVGADEETSEPLVLIRRESPPLAKLLPVVNATSQNLYAEVLLREVALEMGFPASFRGGAQAVEKWLRERRLQRPGFTMVDGSGLSSVNRSPARLFNDVLLNIATSPNAQLFRDSLAEPGKESLKGRFDSEEFGPLRGNLRAKTGFISGAHTLGGYVTNSHGTVYTFVVIVNGYDPERSAEARDFVDRTVLAIQQSIVLP